MTDAEFQKLVAETMEYIHSKRRIASRDAGFQKLMDRWPKGCRDCGCSDPEFYMANDAVWIKAGPNRKQARSSLFVVF